MYIVQCTVIYDIRNVKQRYWEGVNNPFQRGRLGQPRKIPNVHLLMSCMYYLVNGHFYKKYIEFL